MSRSAEIIRLAAADVRHEWRMSLCMALAIAAIATPLLLFFGLKFGVMETLRQRLLDDPSSMEILPLSDKRLDNAWFEGKRRDSRVAFVVPHTRRLSAQAEFAAAGQKKRLMLDISPTLEQDVLLARYGAPVPQSGECVLTASASEKLGVAKGAELACHVSRDRGKVRAQRSFIVAGVLPEGAGVRPAAYLRLEDLEQIEQFKDGRAVPELGWPGSDPLAYPAAPSALLALPAPLNAIREAMLCQNTGFATFEKPEGLAVPGLPAGRALYLLSSVGSLADARDFASVADRVRGMDSFILPVNRNVSAVLALPDGEAALALRAGSAIGRNLPGVTPPDGENWTLFSSAPAPRTLIVSPALAKRAGTGEVPCRFLLASREKDGTVTERSVSFPVRLVTGDAAPEGTGLAAPALLGQLGLLAERPLLDGTTADGQKTMLLGRRGYSGFRMYASGLDKVAPLKKVLEEEGISVSTKADRIEEVLALNKYLGILFWIIAAASLAGAMGCLVSNVYANVERKRRELAVLRLLGVHGAALSLFPLTSAILLSLGGILSSLLLFHVLAFAINRVFSAHLAAGEVFCRLTLSHQAAAIGMALALAAVTGLAASRRMLGIQPAESLRDE